MAENLKTTKFNDGTSIPLVTDNAAWGNLTSPGYCWYNNDAATYKNTYGALYNWYAVNTGKLAPTGWHVVTLEESDAITALLGGPTVGEDKVAGGKMKETGTSHWLSPNTGATNSSGFTGLPGGRRNFNGGFQDVGKLGYWWQSGDWTSSMAWYMGLGFDCSNIIAGMANNRFGFSVRCLRD